MAWSLPRRKNPSLILLIPLFALLHVVTTFQAEYRGNFKDLSFNFDQIDWNEVPSRVLPGFLTQSNQPKVSSIGSEFGMTVVTVRLVPDQIDYNYGQEFFQIFTHPIPRFMWPEKRYPRGEAWSKIHEVARTSTHRVDFVHVPYFSGPSPAYTASWYYIGGIFGIVMGGIFTGTMLRTIRGIYDRSRKNEGFLVLFLILAPIGFSEVSSHPLNWIYTIILVLVPIIIVLWLIKSSRRQKRRSETAVRRV